MKPNIDWLFIIRDKMPIQISAYIFPSSDAHQSEYLAERDKRLAFISGFDGSAGTAVITKTEALLWTDGRYYQQASKQLYSQWVLMKDGQPTTPTVEAWLAQVLDPESTVAVDPSHMSTRAWNSLETCLKSACCKLIPLKINPIDALWKRDQPEAPSNRIYPLPLQYTGQTVKDKLDQVRQRMAEKRASLLVVSALDEIAWFLNLRGSDIDYNPVFFSYLLITLDKLFVFVNGQHTPLSRNSIIPHFQENNVEPTIYLYADIHHILKSEAQSTRDRVWISSSSSYSLSSLIPEEKRLHEITPISIMKAVKNEVEAKGMRECHIRDGMALCQYLAWLERCVKEGKPVDEISGADKLEKLRSQQDNYKGLSFATISASGPNASIIHYHPTPETNRPISDKEMYLCDSGAHYLDGTTDVTRTVHFGTPTEQEITTFTYVLKGQIALGTAVFPRKVKGQFLDTIARKALWDVGLDYGHGTGHGIGHFLNVHEGPMGISIRPMPDDPGLEENMFLSNEPGYYKDGQFGIRIEDIVQIVSTNVGDNFDGRGALTFRTVTMCPIQTKLVDVALLTLKEQTTLNNYHTTVWETLSPLLKQANDEDTLAWLERETQPI